MPIAVVLPTGRIQVGEERRGFLRAARAVVERGQPDAVHRGDEAGHAAVGPLAVVGGGGVEVEVVGARAAGEAEHRQPGRLDHLLGLRRVQDRIPPGDVHAQELGIDGPHDLAGIDADRRQQLRGLRAPRARGCTSFVRGRNPSRIARFESRLSRTLIGFLLLSRR